MKQGGFSWKIWSNIQLATEDLSFHMKAWFLSAVEVNRGPGNYLRMHGKQMTNAVVFIASTDWVQDYVLLYQELLQPLGLLKPVNDPLNCVKNAKLL